ncbi:hypothetical protein LOTGIDRAFT_232991 [Lottia gigantea]|uniref:SGNH domain-containing protein n=1 Tax=Lottia gigantea TaxID=225164 RepID=V3ZMC7_LOTGI|nr:hypothetical protein LOTGIDRAFT_232991 [Lottia gigantea]ESO92523.1 hypothetical protein LOTGIDRAFT_232991 [Lottia gigantea]
MKNGSWLPHKMTGIQRQKIEKFLKYARNGQGIPKTLQRPDKKCGNLPYMGQKGNFFRALCNPKGSTPCCENNKCVWKSLEECQCSNCLDERQSIHAEYSQWIPTDKTCSIRYYNSQEVCKLLNGKTILIVGDSYMRHLYTGLLSFLRNNSQTGALERNPKQNILKECSGMYVFTEKVCRGHIDRNPKNICSGKVNVIFKEHYELRFAKQFKEDVDNITKSESTLIVCGIGLHSQMQSRKILNDYLMPVLNILKTRPKSKLLFATPHAPGLLKSPKFHQSLDIILKFISEMEFPLKKMNIPVFDTVPMTKNIVSFDGNHYGLGLNRQKVLFLLNYIQEIKEQGKW